MVLDTLGGLKFGSDAGGGEQRTEERLALSRQPSGKITVSTPFGRIESSRVRDISRSGISLEVDRPIGQETPVSVEYSESSLNLSVNGRLAWSRTNEKPADAAVAASAYVVGIELFSPGLLLNFLPTETQSSRPQAQ